MAASDDAPLLSQEQKESFQRDGYLVMRGLFDEDELQQLVQSGKAFTGSGVIKSYFSIIRKGAMFTSDDFRSIALHSKLPRIAAELMQLNPSSQSVRILRDVFLAKAVTSDEVCGWHVDDQGFWPESFISDASDQSGLDQNGINAWIALDDMPLEYEGSMAVARGSHTASWRNDAYEAIGQDRTKHGLTKEEFLQALRATNKFGTCELLEVNRPDLNTVLNSSSEQFDLKSGDVILATRLLFHRTMPVTAKGREYFQQTGQENLMRYSIRYVPSTARLTKGFTAEWSCLVNPTNMGRTLDEIVDDEGNKICWYPKVWPAANVENEQNMTISASELASIKEKEAAVFAEFHAALGGQEKD